jgi:NadR type nicotinamide-nucleotide adenylyltransferase
MEESFNYEMNNLKKIALLGPESTGKTALCVQLAAHFNTVYVPEFARQYLLAKGNRYSYEDVVYCMEQQLALEDELVKQASQIIFYDTELMNFKVWFTDIFNKAPEWLDEKIKSHRYDFTLLTYFDVPFETDILRLNKDRREFFFDWYKRELESYGSNYVIIKGLGESRLINAIEAVNRITGKNL